MSEPLFWLLVEDGRVMPFDTRQDAEAFKRQHRMSDSVKVCAVVEVTDDDD